MKVSLQQRLVRWLKNHPGYHASGDLQRLVVAETTYTPRTTVRRLEELAERHEIDVEYRKGHAWYSYRATKSFQETSKIMCELFDKGAPAEQIFAIC